MTEEQYCCDMRAYFLVGIVGQRVEGEPPADAVDFIVEWGPPVLLEIAFCPFCGARLPMGDTLRDPRKETK